LSRAKTWILVAAGVLLGGLGVAIAVDTALAWVSRDYVYSPGEFLRHALRLDPLLATVTAAAATVGIHPPAKPGRILGLVTGGWLVVVTAGLAFAAFRGWTTPLMTDVALAPARRVNFCDGLVDGIRSAQWGVVLLISFALWNSRAADGSPSHSASGTEISG
jgi:hypothetical protein